MNKNFLLKLAFIVGTVLFFLFGIFGDSAKEFFPGQGCLLQW